MKKSILILIGMLSMIFGMIGVVVPMLPSVPFFMLSAFLFAKSSVRLHRWFVGTKFYVNNLETYAQGKGLTKCVKMRIMVTVTLAFMLPIILMNGVLFGQIVIIFIWLVHIIYFMFGVKTIISEKDNFE